jgi:serine protease Do
MRTEGRAESDEEVTDAELGDVVVRLPAIPARAAARMGIETQTEPLPEGVLIMRVVDHSNAARAGLLAGDILQFGGGAPITDYTDLRYVLDRMNVGDTVPVRVLRDGNKLTFSLTFAVHPMAKS